MTAGKMKHRSDKPAVTGDKPLCRAPKESARKAGAAGEDFAALLLMQDGYRILCRNYKGSHGEIDIIAEKDAYIIFAEVKLRKILSQKPAQAVDSEKMLHIVNTAHEFLCEYKENTYIASLSPRFDVIEIVVCKGAPAVHRHLTDVYHAFL